MPRPRLKVGKIAVIHFTDHAGGEDTAEIISAGVIIAFDRKKIVLDHWWCEDRPALDTSAIDRRTISGIQLFDPPDVLED